MKLPSELSLAIGLSNGSHN